MAASGWKRLLAGRPWFRGQDSYPIAAYSEFMPPPRLGLKPYPFAEREPYPFFEDDPSGWQITEYEEALELRPGLERVAAQVVTALVHLGHGRPRPRHCAGNCRSNKYCRGPCPPNCCR